MLFNQTPVTLFEVSWEVCNKVGGIYSVVSSKVLQTRDHFDDDYFLLGPSLQQNSGFEETNEPVWDLIRPALAVKDLKCRLGRWNIPGRPRVILVDSSKRYDSNQLLHELWKAYGVDSLSGGWDYIEPVMFASACGEVIATVHEATVAYEHGRSVALFHEWMCGAGLLQLKREKPEIGTVFTTHATILGRSLAGSGADIYANLRNYNPANEAGVMNVTAKWSMESTSAREADAFTTVSAITGEEAAVFLGCHPAVITTNGLDMRVIPNFSIKRENPLVWRGHILDAARRFLRSDLPESTRIVAISGRYEMHNKGVDVFLEALAQVNRHLNGTNTHVLALCLVMGGHTGVNDQAVSGDPAATAPDGQNFICTHHVWDEPHDSIITACRRLGLNNAPGDNVKVIFVPAMLDGHDGFLNIPYEEVIAACDYGFFPSWYEPWGYTPQESAAWAVPTLTTDLSGFGMWAADQNSPMDAPQEGVVVMNRRGKNYDQTVKDLHERILRAATATEEEIAEWRKATRALAEKTDWSLFYKNYIEAFTIALTKAEGRMDPADTSMKISSTIMAATSSATPFLRPMLAVSKLPPELSRLRELANNLWWCWHN
nr:alpha-glucan family phosphorylase [Desulfovibrio sp.]